MGKFAQAIVNNVILVDYVPYGQHQLKSLATQLQTEFGKGFNERITY